VDITWLLELIMHSGSCKMTDSSTSLADTNVDASQHVVTQKKHVLAKKPQAPDDKV